MKLIHFCSFTLLSLSLVVDTVGGDAGCCFMDNLATLLTLSECERFVDALSRTDEDILRHIESLSPENNDLDLKPRIRRALASDDEDGDKCWTLLVQWLKKNSKETFLDRLTRSLQHIGRTDVAIEISDNINQEESEKLKHYVEGYHKYISSLRLPGFSGEGRNRRRPRGRDL